MNQETAQRKAEIAGLGRTKIPRLDREEVEGLKIECAQHTQAGTLLPVYPPFMLRILDILERAGLVENKA